MERLEAKEFQPEPIIAKAYKDMKQRIEDFRKTDKVNLNPHPSSILGYVLNGSEKGYVPGRGADKTPLYPNVVGELFLSAIGGYQLENTTDFVTYGSDGKTGTYLRIFKIKGEDFAFIRREEFQDGDWKEIVFEIAHSQPLGR